MSSLLRRLENAERRSTFWAVMVRATDWLERVTGWSAPERYCGDKLGAAIADAWAAAVALRAARDE